MELEIELGGDAHRARKPGTEATTASPGPRATTRIAQVLRILADHPQGATLTGLAELSATPKTSLLALLRALTHAHYLAHNGGKYALGVEAFKLGAAIVAQRRFPEIARPVMERLALEAGETILIGQLASDRPSMVYVMSAESRSAIRFIAGIGERRELFSSSGGRVLLAAMSEAQQAEYLRTADLRAHTPATRTLARAESHHQGRGANRRGGHGRAKLRRRDGLRRADTRRAGCGDRDARDGHAREPRRAGHGALQGADRARRGGRVGAAWLRRAARICACKAGGLSGRRPRARRPARGRLARFDRTAPLQ
ncbi:IclR family transcriptional regulator [Paraburkholderia unamae]|uniref:IclR family transcriptional regulator n=1 Tax=Paraburkholderia unamae TaxID=219649 RepID=UPI001FCB4A84|nr:IclR family transcriptional regulator C-terminal domain-containing protein [Paraburkholderia unamae]